MLLALVECYARYLEGCLSLCDRRSSEGTGACPCTFRIQNVRFNPATDTMWRRLTFSTLVSGLWTFFDNVTDEEAKWCRSLQRQESEAMCATRHTRESQWLCQFSTLPALKIAGHFPAFFDKFLQNSIKYTAWSQRERQPDYGECCAQWTSWSGTGYRQLIVLFQPTFKGSNSLLFFRQGYVVAQRELELSLDEYKAIHMKGGVVEYV